MKFKKFSASQYKPFPGSVEIELKPITLIFGRNNSGKTALARLPRLIQSSLAPVLSHAPRVIPLSYDGVSFGDSLKDLVHGKFPTGRFDVGAEFENGDGDIFSFATRIQLVDDLRFSPAVIDQWKISNPVVAEYNWDRGHEAAIVYREDVGVSFSGMFPNGLSGVSQWRGEFLQHLSNCQHFLPVRSPLLRRYEINEGVDGNSIRIDADGTGAADLLRLNPELLEKVNAWCQRNLGGMDVRVVPETISYKIVGRRNGAIVDLCDAGQGIQQFFPILVHLISRIIGQGAGFVDVFEQPELHLHDAIHPEIADLLIQSVETGGQVLVETHSEGLLMRLRRRLAERRILEGSVAIYWVSDDGKVARINIDQDGNLDGWPGGVFFETYEELKCVRAAARHHAI